MKPKYFDKWYDGFNNNKFERITKQKSDQELKSKLLFAQLACTAVSYAICYN